jgi:hypothetical protein
LKPVIRSTYWALWSRKGNQLLTQADGRVDLWRKRRPERWWGVFYLREFWATVIFAAFLAWSLWRDRKYFRVLDERIAAARAAKAAAKSQGGPGAPAP